MNAKLKILVNCQHYLWMDFCQIMTRHLQSKLSYPYGSIAGFPLLTIKKIYLEAAFIINKSFCKLNAV